MKIFIGGDSRCAQPPDKDWTTLLKSPITEKITYRSCVEIPTFVIFLLSPILEKYADDYFDVIIVQSGWNDGAYPWPKTIYDALLKENYQPDNPEKVHLNETRIKQVFELLCKKSKHVLFIGMHEPVFKVSQWKSNVSEMMEVYSTIPNIDILYLPSGEKWAEEHTNKEPALDTDGIHYNEKGRIYIAEKVDEYLRRVNISTIYCGNEEIGT